MWKMHASKVSIVIPTYNRREDVLECLLSLKRQDYPNYEIIVVDNASTDGTAEAIKQRFPDMKLVKSQKNLGVTGGRNLGAKHANGDYVLFLDHDTVVDGRMLFELTSVMHNDSSIGLAGPIVYYYDDPRRIWAAGTSISLISGRISFNFADAIDHGQFNNTMEVQVLPAALLVKKEVLNKVEPFDDTFFAVYEDTDFCFRVREAGYKVVCVPKAKIWHKTPLDRRVQALWVLSRAYYIARNRIIFMKKHVGNLRLALFLTIFLWVYALYYILKSFQFMKMRYAVDFWNGIIDGLLHIAGFKS